MNKLDRYELLCEALTSAFGIIVETNSPNRLKQALYVARKENEDFLVLSFVTSPTAPEAELWIVRKPTEKVNDTT